MELIKDTFEISPSTNIIDVLGSSGYSLETALSDIIDNSIAAKATKIELYFNIKNLDDDTVIIKDNGKGMSLEDLKKAAIIAHTGIDEEREDDDLGRYSMGLKSASMSFCDKLYIVSKQKDSDVNSICIDFEGIKANNSWTAYVLDCPELEELIDDCGTVIAWKKLSFIDKDSFDRGLLNSRLYSIETHISHVYAEYIKSNKVAIYLEDNLVEAWDPFMLYRDDVKILDIDPIMYKGSRIKVTPYILPVISSLAEDDQRNMMGRGLSEQQGFYVYRNNRLISEGGWLGLPGLNADNKSAYARIRIDISPKLDKEFKVNFMKNSLEIPDKLRTDFVGIARMARKESAHSFAYTKDPKIARRKKNKDIIPVWNVQHTEKAIVLSVNEEHPIINELMQQLGKRTSKKLFSLLAKSFPVALVQNNDVKEKGYSKGELWQLIDETYQSLVKQGMSDDKIKQTMVSMEPFSQNQYREILIEYFFGIEEE